MTPPERPPLVDSHCHLNDPAFHADLAEVLERAWEAGLRAIVCPGYDLASSARAVSLAQAHRGVFAAVGIHPNYAAQAAPDDLRRLEELAQAPSVVAIGETGLDFYRSFSPPALQEVFLSRHLELADRFGLPVIIHNRQAEHRLTQWLVDWANGAPRRTGVLHCFSGDRSMLERCSAAGFYVSFAGTLTFKHAGWVTEAARVVPAEMMLVETDAPYLAPAPLRGRRNEPAWVVHTARRLAELRGVPFAEVAETTSQNAMKLFAGVQESSG